MPLIKSPDAPEFSLPHLAVKGLAAPSRGARETCVWQIILLPGATGALHSVDREEIFVGLHGRARATVADASFDLDAGDTLIVPANTPFSLANPDADADPFVALCVLPVGGQARLPEGAPFLPPWAQ